MDIMKKARAACLKYLELRNYVIVNEDYEGYAVIRDIDEDCIAFVHVIISDDKLHRMSHHVTRKSFEKVISKYMKSHDDIADVFIRYDEISISLLGESRAIVKHHINADNRLEGE